MKTPGDEAALVHCFLYANASDLPAARKASGLRGHTSTWFMCPVCHQPMHSLTDPECFDSDSEFQMICVTHHLWYILWSDHLHRGFLPSRGTISKVRISRTLC